MDLRLLMISSLLCSTSITSVVAQDIIPVGIQWNGFDVERHHAHPDPFSADPIIAGPFWGHDLPPIHSPYSYHALGIFCKAEVKLNSLLPFPIMMRLGDVQRAEELDGKGEQLTRPSLER